MTPRVLRVNHRLQLAGSPPQRISSVGLLRLRLSLRPRASHRAFSSTPHLGSNPTWGRTFKESVGHRPRHFIVVLACCGCIIGLAPQWLASSALRNDSGDSSQTWPSGKASIVTSKAERDVAFKRQLSAAKRKEDELIRDTARHSRRPPDEDMKPALVEPESSSSWAQIQDKFAEAGSTISSIQWSSIPDSVTDFVVPTWVRVLPGFITKLQQELSMATGSLADEIWQEAHDADLHPEIAQDAYVRISNDISPDEKAFVRKRREVARSALAKYLNLGLDDVHLDDVPTIAICGSGGGLRALVAGASSYMSSQEAGLFDCATYVAGVSGSCWLQALYYSSLGGRRFDKLVDHLKARIGVHIAFPPTALGLISTAPTNKYLLSGLVERLKGDSDANFGLVDVYGLLLAARLMVPKGELEVNEDDLKMSNQRNVLQRGQHPMPIYTAVRHEIPLEEESVKADDSVPKNVDEVKEKAKQEAWFQWFEMTPFEFWCEELEAGIPTWAMGRKFQNGRNVSNPDEGYLPELRLPMMLGIWGSAFCATLSHYYREIQPVLKGLTGFGGLDQLIEERDEELIKVHPITPSSIPNYVLGLKEQLPQTCPESIFTASHLQLMDAGMSNNLPIYPLLRPGRDVDILVAFDASADIQNENWLSVADGYARQRGIKGWPVGIGWPKTSADHDANVEQLEAAQAGSPKDAANKVEDAKEAQLEQSHQADTGSAQTDKPSSNTLGHCTVWVGTTEERSYEDEPPPSKKIEADWELMQPNAGLTFIYFPFIPNEKVEGVDPTTSDFMSTWNFIYTPEDVDKVVALARANFEAGKEQTKGAVRAVYERKKKKRQEKEEDDKLDRRRRKVRLGILGKKGEGDHFS
ncbi:MAG: hypothetical protein M1833_007391 [Piccolia ochrophora]|nr:MAG: hypothetical protein M1833_007391 [Piccolia ochrophora]